MTCRLRFCYIIAYISFIAVAAVFLFYLSLADEINMFNTSQHRCRSAANKQKHLYVFQHWSLHVVGINSVAETVASFAAGAQRHRYFPRVPRNCDSSALGSAPTRQVLAAARRATATVDLSVNRRPRPVFEETTKYEYSSSLLWMLYRRRSSDVERMSGREVHYEYIRSSFETWAIGCVFALQRGETAAHCDELHEVVCIECWVIPTHVRRSALLCCVRSFILEKTRHAETFGTI